MKHEHQRKVELDQSWPNPPLNIVLVEPEIPPNTGTIARLCAATGSILHLVGPLGFQLTDKALKRAGLDYWDSVQIEKHSSWDQFAGKHLGPACYFYSTAGTQSYTACTHRPGDYLIFGSETRGLANAILDQHQDRTFGIPMDTNHVRSLNLAMSAGIVLYEALRQINFA